MAIIARLPPLRMVPPAHTRPVLQPHVCRLHPFVSPGVGYCLNILDPDMGELKLANGDTIAWLRYSCWMVTCPVLLMFLTVSSRLVRRLVSRLVSRLVGRLVPRPADVPHGDKHLF